MEFKNIEIINIANALTNIYNCSKTAKQRFYIAPIEKSAKLREY